MEEICANCNKFDAYKRRNKGELYCEQCKNWVMARDNACKKFEALPTFGAYDKKERSMEELKSNECYITTAVVHILGMKDDCEILQTLRLLRGIYMQENPKYRDLLMTYDVVGPMIASSLMKDENRLQVANDIFICLDNAFKLIHHGKMESAIAIYVDMTEALMRKYAPSYVIGEVAAMDYDQLSGGHGAFAIKRRS